MDQAHIDAELDRARSTYEQRDDDPRLANVYEPILPGPMFTVQEREWLTAQLLRRSGLSTLRGLDILDVGCGSGIELQRLALLGADPTRMAGIDLMENRVAAARHRMPNATFHVGSAHELPFPDDSFDLVLQFTVFSSIMSADLRAAIATEMMRVVRPRGRIFWYDISMPRYSGPAIHSMDRREVAGLFPGCDILARSSTLRWEILRRIVPTSRHAGLLLERLSPLNSHLIAVIRPPG